MSSTTAIGSSDDPAGGALVSRAERTAFVEAVLGGKLEPDFTAVAYHFEGWLDKDVVDAIFEVSSDPSEAVSGLAGMFPAEAEPADSRQGNAADTEALSALAAARAAIDSRQGDIVDTVAEASSGQTEVVVSARNNVFPPVEAPADVLKAEAVAQFLVNKSSDPTNAVSAPDGASPPAEASADNNCSSDRDHSSDSDSSSGSSSGSGSDSDSEASDEEGTNQAPKTNPRAAVAAAAAARSLEDAVARGTERHARTLEAIQAQKAPPFPAAQNQRLPPTPPATTAVAVEEDVAESSSAAAAARGGETAGGQDGGGGGGAPESEEEMPPADDDNSSNAELEKVAAFIASYAGEQEAVRKASRPPTKPPKPPFLVPRGTPVPSTTKVQLAIAGTAEKTAELPGFEAFMKLQHAKDGLFRFLASDHALHSYYLLAKAHVQETVRRGGKAKGACTGAAAPKEGVPAAAGGKSTEDPDVAEIMRMLGGAGP